MGGQASYSLITQLPCPLISPFYRNNLDHTAQHSGRLTLNKNLQSAHIYLINIIIFIHIHKLVIIRDQNTCL